MNVITAVDEEGTKLYLQMGPDGLPNILSSNEQDASPIREGHTDTALYQAQQRFKAVGQWKVAPMVAGPNAVPDWIRDELQKELAKLNKQLRALVQEVEHPRSTKIDLINRVRNLRLAAARFERQMTKLIDNAT